MQRGRSRAQRCPARAPQVAAAAVPTTAQRLPWKSDVQSVEEMRSQIEQERQQFIERKLTASIAAAAPAPQAAVALQGLGTQHTSPGVSLSADMVVPTKEELMRQLNAEREAFIRKRKAEEMAASAAVAV